MKIKLKLVYDCDRPEYKIVKINCLNRDWHKNNSEIYLIKINNNVINVREIENLKAVLTNQKTSCESECWFVRWENWYTDNQYEYQNKK